MTLQELEAEIPNLRDYTASMPPEIRRHALIKVHPPGSLIHQKDSILQHFGIVAKGENRVINEFENGKIYMIETNCAIDFIGEVTLLAQMEKTSVTIEAITANTVIYIPRKDAEKWISMDNRILRKMAERTAFKLYRSSYNNGLKLYYPPAYLLADHLVRMYEQHFAASLAAHQIPPQPLLLSNTREWLGEALGMNIKTLDRTIRTMNKEHYFDLTKGKITLDHTQYLLLKEYLSTSIVK